MAENEKSPDVAPEDTSWVEAVSNEKEAEKHVMLEMSNIVEDKSKKSRRCQKLLYFLLFACVVTVVVLAVKLSNANKSDGPLQTIADAEYTETKQVVAIEKKDDSVEEKDDSKDVNKTKQEVCLTHDCILASAQVILGVDSTVDPCDNFYEFACGGWMQTHAVPIDRGNLASYGEVRDEVSIKLKGLLEEDIDEDEIDTFQNLKKLYKSCIDEDLIEKRNESVIYPLLGEFGGWPLLGDAPGGKWNESEFDLVRLLLAILKYNNKPLVGVWAGMDDKNNSRNILFIDEQGFGMSSTKYFLDPDLEDKKQAYKTLIRNVGVMLGADVNTIDADVNDMVQLETELANITMLRADRRDYNLLYNKMTIKELKLNHTNIKKCSKIKFDWLEYLQGAMKIPDEPVDITEEEDVVLVSKLYYGNLWDVLNNHSPRTVANYAIWRIVKHRVNNLPLTFREEYQEYKKAIYGSSASRDRWRTCTSYVHSVNGMALGRMFVEKYFDERSKTETEDMISNIRKSFYDGLDNLNWMDDDMKKAAREKAENMAAAVGYKDSHKNDTVLEDEHPLVTMDEEKYFENVITILSENSKYYFKSLRDINADERPMWVAAPAVVNAFYTPQMNQISIPAGIQQPPYFHVGRPRAMNYGALGFLIGHEISHGFDDSGRRYDKDGNLYNWWSPEADVMFKKHAQCIVDQYGQFFWEEAGLNVNGMNTQGENIADNGGIKQAFGGYKRWRQTHDELILPGLKYTHEQLFFIGFAQSRCAISRKADAVDHILSGVHSPNSFRIIGSLRNMPEFADVFHCPVNSSMNPEDKCAVW